MSGATHTGSDLHKQLDELEKYLRNRRKEAEDARDAYLKHAQRVGELINGLDQSIAAVRATRRRDPWLRCPVQRCRNEQECLNLSACPVHTEEH